MNKLASIFMVIAVLLCFTGCKSNSDNNVQPTNTSEELELHQQEDSYVPEEELSEKDSETGSESLVVYFSWSGNTENVAKAIQAQTDSDIFEIVPSIPYSDDYDTVVELAQQEQRDNARPEISGNIENIEQYNVIYVGFPNWWGDMPMILYTFFDSYDLSGKTVAPFCTSGGSGLSNTVNEIKDLEPEAAVIEGLHIGSGSASSPDDSVSDWLEKNNLK